MFFNGSGLRWAGHEVSLSVEERSLRIDRLVALQDPYGTVWWVLDYKLHPVPQTVAQYRLQLAAYQRAVECLQADDVDRAAFITGE